MQRRSKLHEYRFAEAVFELLPMKAVAATAFEIELELTGGTGKPGRLGDGRSVISLAVSLHRQHVGTTHSFRRAGSQRRKICPDAFQGQLRHCQYPFVAGEIKETTRHQRCRIASRWILHRGRALFGGPPKDASSHSTILRIANFA